MFLDITEAHLLMRVQTELLTVQMYLTEVRMHRMSVTAAILLTAQMKVETVLMEEIPEMEVQMMVLQMTEAMTMDLPTMEVTMMALQMMEAMMTPDTVTRIPAEMIPTTQGMNKY